MKHFLYWNLRHYLKAIWGFGLKLDPDYPPTTDFLPGLIYDTVFEWRTYGAMFLVSLLTAGIAFIWEPAAWILLLFWTLRSWQRSKYFRSNFAYWQQALKESPFKARPLQYYMEWCIRETERAWKAGNRERAMELEQEAFQIQDRICQK